AVCLLAGRRRAAAGLRPSDLGPAGRGAGRAPARPAEGRRAAHGAAVRRPPRLSEPSEPPGPPRPGMGRGPSLTPRLAKRIAILGGIVMVLFGVLVVRLWFLQVVGSKGVGARAGGDRLRTMEIPAPRGDIVDRNGRVLATSRLGYDIVALPGELVGPDNRLTARARGTLQRLGEAIGESPRKLNAKVLRGAETPFESVVLESDISDA